MQESKYLKDDYKNIHKLKAFSNLKDFSSEGLGDLLKLSKVRQYKDP